METDHLNDRFNRLRVIVCTLEWQISNLPVRVVERFNCRDLAGIHDLLLEKRLLLERIRLLNLFIQKWEKQNGEIVLGVINVEK